MKPFLFFLSLFLFLTSCKEETSRPLLPRTYIRDANGQYLGWGGAFISGSVIDGLVVSIKNEKGFRYTISQGGHIIVYSGLTIFTENENFSSNDTLYLRGVYGLLSGAYYSEVRVGSLDATPITVCTPGNNQPAVPIPETYTYTWGESIEHGYVTPAHREPDPYGFEMYPCTRKDVGIPENIVPPLTFSPI